MDAAATILEAAHEVNRKSDQNALEQASSKLAGAKELDATPEYWKAAGALITYRSANVEPADFITPKLPSCFDQKPEATLAKDIDATQTTIQINPPVYAGCEMELDSPKAAAIYAKFLSFSNIEFRNCRVMYRGGLVPFPVNAAGNLIFKQCKFNMSSPSVPLGVGRIVLAELLAAPSLEQVAVKVSG